MPYRFLIVGAGFSGSVLARELVTNMDCHVDIWEERNHIAGNCYTSEDEETGITIHHYGPHIFNTDKKHIWDYFNQYSPLRPYIHHVKAFSKGKVYSLPINLSTLNQFFNRTLNPETAKNFLESIREESINNPSNFEEQAIRLLGKDLYYAFFYGYTKKQWGCEPKELPASVFKRLPVRFNYDDNYHHYQYTGIPEKGYTDFAKNLLNHPNIHLSLNKAFSSDYEYQHDYDHVFYTGSIDAFFNYSEGRLSYRTLKFDKNVLNGDYQGCAQINYCDEDLPYTRTTEHKHFTPWKKFGKTVVFTEYSSEALTGDVLYYPKGLKHDKIVFEKYLQLAKKLNGVSFLGRLGNYRYMDMQHVIDESINTASEYKVSQEYKNRDTLCQDANP